LTIWNVSSPDSPDSYRDRDGLEHYLDRVGVTGSSR